MTDTVNINSVRVWAWSRLHNLYALTSDRATRDAVNRVYRSIRLDRIPIDRRQVVGLMLFGIGAVMIGAAIALPKRRKVKVGTNEHGRDHTRTTDNATP